MCHTRMSRGTGIRRVRCCWTRCRGRWTAFEVVRVSLCLAIRDRLLGFHRRHLEVPARTFRRRLSSRPDSWPLLANRHEWNRDVDETRCEHRVARLAVSTSTARRLGISCLGPVTQQDWAHPRSAVRQGASLTLLIYFTTIRTTVLCRQ